MTHKPVAEPEIGTRYHGRCVYTTLIGRYERLNDQPIAAQSTLPFICLTDDPDLKSESWKIRHVSPIFGMDPVRSQRELKLRPHVYLPEFDSSLYIDNSVLLARPPEWLFERHFPASGIFLAEHSFRESILDEFLEVARLGLDDQSRIFEQLNHYAVDFPDVLTEKPYWTAIMLRDHRNPKVKAMLEIWTAHVHRYSRRDQLSVNVAFRLAGLTPDVMKIDNHLSWFHSWPHVEDRAGERGMRRPGNSLMPPVAHIRRLEQSMVEQARRHEQALAEQARQYEALLGSTSWRIATLLSKYAHLHPRLARFVRHGLKLCYWTVTFQLHRRLLQLFSRYPLRDSASDLPPAPAYVPSNHVHMKGTTIYVDPEDERGRQLVLHNGDFNPPALKMWKHLIAAESWTHIIDVGANYGEMLVNVDLPPGAQVTAVEPNPRVLPYLERTLTEAGIRAEIVRCAVAEHAGNAPFLIDHDWSGRSRIPGPEDLEPGATLEPISIPTTTLAGLLVRANGQTNIRALVKIDVEGREVNILREAMQVLDDIERFEVLAEILHLTSSDLVWLLENFEVQLYDLEADRLVQVVPGTPDRLATLLTDSRFYGQDAVLRPKRKPG